MFKLNLGINRCSSQDYHAEREYLSSSVLKTIYKDLAEYHNQYILGNRKTFSASSQAAMDEGSAAHTLILQPELFDSEFALFPDWVKRGSAYEAFCAANPGKIVLSEPQYERIQQLVATYKKHILAVSLHQNGEPELSICGELQGIKVKIRADYINVERGQIIDIKTTAYPGDQESFKLTMQQLSYQLSGALYLAVAEQHYSKPFEFLFTVLSKKDNSCNVYRLSERSRAEGARMVAIALHKFKNAKETSIWRETAPDSKNLIQEILEV